ncbi:MAG: extensin family protein [Byssovorax sp.]
MKILPPKPFLALAIAALALGRPAPARAFSPYLVVPDPAVAEASPAYRYANMSDAEAFEELDRRKILYTKLDATPGVRAPIRLTGRLHGVYIHSSLPPDERVKTMFEILDARLGLTLDDFSAILERHDIDEVVHFTMYRPNVGAPTHEVQDEPQARAPVTRPRSSNVKAPPAKAAPQKAPPSLGIKGTIDAGKREGPAPVSLKQKPGEPGPKPVVMVTARKPWQKPLAVPVSKPLAAAPPPLLRRAPITVARRDPQPSGLHQTTWAPPGTRHPAGLAIDVGLLHKKDGRWLSVARQFQGHIGDKTCGDGAYVPEAPDARELRALVCEASDLGVFTYVLTPDYNAAHVDHFHMEIKPGVRWFLYH